jgi:hypothetical protein
MDWAMSSSGLRLPLCLRSVPPSADQSSAPDKSTLGSRTIPEFHAIVFKGFARPMRII